MKSTLFVVERWGTGQHWLVKMAGRNRPTIAAFFSKAQAQKHADHLNAEAARREKKA